MVVVFPEPDGPMMPRIVPVRTVSEIPSTAVSSPNRFVTLSMTTAASVSGRAPAVAAAPVGEGDGSISGGLLGLSATGLLRPAGLIPPRLPHGRGGTERSIRTAGYRAADAGRERGFIDIANALA